MSRKPFFLSMCITLSHLSRDILAFRKRCVMKSIYGVMIFSTCHHLFRWCASHHVTCHYHTFINTFIMPNHIIQHVICRFVHVTLPTLIFIYFKVNIIQSVYNPHYNIHTILVYLGHGCVMIRMTCLLVGGPPCHLLCLPFGDGMIIYMDR